MRRLLLLTLLVGPAALVHAQQQAQVFNWANPQSFLGVGLAEVDNGKVSEWKLPGTYGAIVTLVYENSPAEKAGLKVNDVIVEFNGQRVEGQSQLRRYISETPIGRDVKLLVYREGRAQNVVAQIGKRADFAPAAAVLASPGMTITVPDMPRPRLYWDSSLVGIEGEAVRGQFAEFFGVKSGVLVRSVRNESIAAKAGLKAGDIITKVDGQSVLSPIDVSEAVRRRDKNLVPFTVVREKQEVTLSLDWKDEPREPLLPRTRAVRKSGEPFPDGVADDI